MQSSMGVGQPSCSSSNTLADRLRWGVAELNPGYGALVMATGIVSIGFDLFGHDVLSDVLLVIAVAAFAVLLVAYAWRATRHPARLLADAQDPATGFGYFSLVAAADVVAGGLASNHHLTATWVLGAASLPLWLVLTYGIPGAMVMGRREGAVLPGVNGSWFLWVVATQSLSTTAATLANANANARSWLAPLAVALWGIGVVLYLIVAGVVTVRLLEVPVAPHALSPTYWVFMGATAITVLGAAEILMLPASLPVVLATREVISGLAFLLWAFGTWWIPLLLFFTVWRQTVHDEPRHYDATWWDVVFPLGMYAVASAAYGKAAGLGFMVDIARWEVWLGLAAWVGVTAAMLGSFQRSSAPVSALRPCEGVTDDS